MKDDQISGAIGIVIGIICLVLCLTGLVTILKKLLLGASTRIIEKATKINGYVSMLVGCGITVAIQSSSVTTSVLTPLVGVGVVSVDQMYPLTLGANVGTTATSILAALVADAKTSMQVALAHFLFNVCGILIWYPVPAMRRVPVRMARALGRATRWWRGFPLVYLGVVFFALPLLLLGLSSLFARGSKALAALGYVLVVSLGLAIARSLWWWFREDGAARTEASFRRRQLRRDVMRRIVEEWDPLVEDVGALRDRLGCEDFREGEEDVAKAVR